MKYSALVPIRSRNEVYTPFSGIKTRKATHKRVQSETPTINTTMAMGIQCDSTDFLTIISTENYISTPIEKLPNLKEEDPKPKVLIKVNNNEQLNLNELYSIVDKCSTPSNSDINSEDSLHILNKIQFSKIGDWNETYVLKNKNSNHYLNYRKIYNYNNSKIQVRKPCKIVEFTPNLAPQSKKINESNLPWQFKCTEKSVFNTSGILRIQNRCKTINLKY